MISNALKMLKDPNNRGMLDMMKQQNPNLNVDMMVRGIEAVAKIASFTQQVRRAWSSVFVRLAVFGIIVAIIAYFFG